MAALGAGLPVKCQNMPYTDTPDQPVSKSTAQCIGYVILLRNRAHASAAHTSAACLLCCTFFNMAGSMPRERRM